jgi:hypothetical protein
MKVTATETEQRRGFNMKGGETSTAVCERQPDENEVPNCSSSCAGLSAEGMSIEMKLLTAPDECGVGHQGGTSASSIRSIDGDIGTVLKATNAETPTSGGRDRLPAIATRRRTIRARRAYAAADYFFSPRYAPVRFIAAGYGTACARSRRVVVAAAALWQPIDQEQGTALRLPAPQVFARAEHQG